MAGDAFAAFRQTFAVVGATLVAGSPVGVTHRDALLSRAGRLCGLRTAAHLEGRACKVTSYHPAEAGVDGGEPVPAKARAAAAATHARPRPAASPAPPLPPSRLTPPPRAFACSPA